MYASVVSAGKKPAANSRDVHVQNQRAPRAPALEPVVREPLTCTRSPRHFRCGRHGCSRSSRRGFARRHHAVDEHQPRDALGDEFRHDDPSRAKRLPRCVRKLRCRRAWCRWPPTWPAIRPTGYPGRSYSRAAIPWPWCVTPWKTVLPSAQRDGTSTASNTTSAMPSRRHSSGRACPWDRTARLLSYVINRMEGDL